MSLKTLFFGILRLALIAACSSSLYAASPKHEPKNFAVFCSAGLPAPEKEKVLIEFQKFVAGGGSPKADPNAGMVPGDTIRLYDAQTLDTIGDPLTIPPNARTAVLQLNSAKGVVESFRKFLKESDRPDAVVNLPRLVESFREKVPETNTSILLIGNPMYHDDVSAHDMRQGWLSDGYFSQDHSATVFSTQGRAGMMGGNKVVFCTIPDDGWGTENKGVHQERTRRFWSLYLGECGGSLVSFQHDASTAFHDLVSGSLQDIAQLNSYKIDPEDKQMVVWKSITEMQKGTKSGIAASGTIMASGTNAVIDLSGLDWLTKEAAEFQRIHPGPSPIPETSKCTVGLLWSTVDNPPDTDLDLHVRLKGSKEDLYWKNNHTSLGTHYKDFSNPDAKHGYEIAEINVPVKLKDLDIWVNVFKGESTQGFSGEVRVLYAGKLFSYPFSIPGTNGNGGAETPSRNKSLSWSRIPTEIAR